MEKLSSQDIERILIGITTKLLIESGEPYQRDVKMDASLQRHLGIDSLGRAELFQRVEKAFAVSIPDRLLAEADTLNDIAAFLQTAKPGTNIHLQRERVTTHGEKANVDPSVASSLVDVLKLYAESSPNKAHIYFQHEDGQEEIITYGQLLENSLRVAHSLQDLGLQPGEAVAIMQPTHPRFFYTFFGTLLAGGIPVPIYPPFRMHMLETYAKTEARILTNAEVRVLVTFDQAETLSHLLKTFVPSLKHLKTAQELLEASPLQNPFAAQGSHFAFIQYTSGSTADPKGVLLTHFNLLSNIRAYGKAINVQPDDVAISWLPLYHDMGLIGMWLGSLYFGVPLVLLTPFSFLNHPEKWLWAIHYHRGTLSGAPNFAYELCIRKIDPSKLEGLDLSSWRMAANGAEKVYPKTLEDFANKFAPYGFKREALLPVYGLAESTVALAIPTIGKNFQVDKVNRKQFETERRAVPATDKNTLSFVACGHAMEGHEIRIVDNENKILPERHVGSLQFRGPSSMQGYYNNPKATEAIYFDGWLDSGDLAYQADGEIYITGRRKDLIIKAGRNLYPAEIEELVGAVSGVRQGCVTAFNTMDHQRGTEQLIVVAETKEKDKEKRKTIITNINDVISTALDIVPDDIVLVAPHTVPKTSSGKLQRAACKKMYEEHRLGKIHIPAWVQIVKLGAQGTLQKILGVIQTFGKLMYSIYMVVLFAITILPLYFIVRFSPRKTAAEACRTWARFMRFMSFSPMKMVGKENLTKVQPVIYVSNHASYIDAVVTLATVPASTRLVGKKELFNVPFLRTFMRKLNYLEVDRLDLSKGIEDTKQISQVLKDGDSVLIFPEGTFSYSSGLRPFRLGAFKIAVESDIAICPIALKGTRAFLRGEEKLMRPTSVTVTVCEPIKAQGAEWQDVTQLRNTVRAEIAKYCGEPSLDFIAAQTVALNVKE